MQENCEPGVTWQDLAFFNYGTTNNDEVNRCLIEQAGVRENGLKHKAEETENFEYLWAVDPPEDPPLAGVGVPVG